MKIIFTIVLLLISQFASANTPTIDETQKYITEVMNNPQKVKRNYKSKFSFTSQCILDTYQKGSTSRSDITKTYSINFNKYKYKTYETINGMNKEGVFISDSEYIESITSQSYFVDNDGSTKKSESTTHSFVFNGNIFEIKPIGVYKDKLIKAFNHLSKVCFKGDGELF